MNMDIDMDSSWYVYIDIDIALGMDKGWDICKGQNRDKMWILMLV